MHPNPLETFQEHIQKYTQNADFLAKKHRILSFWRLLSFLTAAILFFYFFSQKEMVALAILLLTFPILFGFLINKHHRLSYKLKHARFLKRVNEEEILKSNHHWESFDTGQNFEEILHPYTSDLDIFGQNSLYQLLSRCTTDSGRNTLAQWLKKPASPKAITERGTAVKELGGRLDWRQDFQASGLHFEDPKGDIATFLQWVGDMDEPPRPHWLSWASFLLPIATLTLIILNVFAGLSSYFIVALTLLNGFVLKQVYDQVKSVTEKTEASIKALKTYAALIGLIEKGHFEAPHLKELQSCFTHEGFGASEAIKKLQRLLDRLQSRGNIFYLLINVLLLMDIHLLNATLKWKKKYRKEVSLWFDAIGKYEALCSLAGFHYANPGYTFPEVISEKEGGKPLFTAQKLGHPLIRDKERVYNDFGMEGSGKVIIITGSNMSGKSTFLRTVGINTVLTLSGAPVCAEKLSLSPLQLFTSMRTQDNLKEHVSSFYAELKRIRQLLDVLEKPEMPVLYMLDEVLKGTNSKDRHQGAAALALQLSGKKALGFISTHDLELGELAETLPYTKNYSFNSEIIGDEIHFDYRLSEGICHSFNASKLMQKMGIAMEEH